MKTRTQHLIVALALLGLSTFIFQPSSVLAQGTAFTYQGQLQSSGIPAKGDFDFTFALFNADSTTAGQIGGTVTNSGVGVTNGLFTVTLDFGPVFAGNAAWLAIGVRTNGGASFTVLNPLQELTPTPYAIFANSATNLSGTLPVSQLSGTPGAAVNFTGSLEGDVRGTQQATVVSTVGGQSAASIASGVIAANGATSSNTPGATVARDAEGNFSAGSVTLGGSLNLPFPATIYSGTNTVMIDEGNLFLGLNAGSGAVNESFETGIGDYTLSSGDTGFENVALGESALLQNTSGAENVAAGNGALFSNTTGTGNTAAGDAALFDNTTGSFNIAVGLFAGANLTTGSDNIDIGNAGVAGENSTMRLGIEGTQSNTYIAGIWNSKVTVGAQPVFVDSTGLLGTGTASINITTAPGLGGGGTVSLGGSLTLSNTGVLAVAGDANITATAVNGTVTLSDNSTPLPTGGTLVSRDTTGSFSATSLTLGGTLNLPFPATIYSGTNTVLIDEGNLFLGLNAGSGAFAVAETGIGDYTLSSGDMGSDNTAVGTVALLNNTIGSYNTAVGVSALVNNTTGNNNVAVGSSALYSNTIGQDNIAVGLYAGFNLATGSYNVDIGNEGVAGENGTIRIGNEATPGNTYGTQSNTYVAGIWNSTVSIGAQPVFVDNTGHLGTGTGIALISINTTPGLGGGGSVPFGGSLTLSNTGVLAVAGDANITAAAVNGTVTLSDNSTPLATPGTLVSRDTTGSFSAASLTLGGSLNLPFPATIYSGGNPVFTVSGNSIGLPGLVLIPNAENAPNLIGGSSNNSVSSTVIGGTIGGGGGNSSSGPSLANSITGNFGTVGGGGDNLSGVFATVAGGQGNTATGEWSAVGGGSGNQATDTYATIAGGLNNINGGGNSFIGGGQDNTNGGGNSFIGGGSGNTIDFSSGISGAPSAVYSVICGGADNEVGLSAVSGGGTTGGSYSFIGGGSNNFIPPTGVLSFVGGGQSNTNGGGYSFIGGGSGNTVDFGSGVSGTPAAGFSFIGGGEGNSISLGGGTSPTGGYSFIGGGSNNSISFTGVSAVVAGGANNVASGVEASVPGGNNNVASGEYAFAAGDNAQAANKGAFVWSDGSGTATSTFANNEFIARASGGVVFLSGTQASPTSYSSGTAGVVLAPGATSWATVSDRNAKKNFQTVDTVAVLEKLAAIPIEQWNYKWEKDTDVPHLGPMAQDFKTAFYRGADDKSISTLEFDGVELAAIQGLNQKLEEKEARIEAQDSILRRQAADIDALKARLEQVEKMIASMQEHAK